MVTFGFDTHSTQVNQRYKTGTHANLMKQLSDAIKAFMDDLKFLACRKEFMEPFQNLAEE
jgi:hypothetical protein